MKISKYVAVGLLMLSAFLTCKAERPVSPDKENTGEGIVAPVPPAEHPRLYIRKNEIQDLRLKLQSESAKKILRQMEKMGEDRTPAEEAKETDRGFRYYAKMRGLTTRAQLQALNYLVYGTKSEARTAITTMLDSLKKTHFGTASDLSRASGSMLMVGAIVYDWCYDQMTSEERQGYIKEFIRISGTMESGYPPKRTESVAGHLSEWMILRDMLSAGIAVYNEYPDMYNYVITMLTEDYKPVRDFIYSGGNYHQGTSYVNVRFGNDMFAQWILHKMGAGDFFNASQQYVMYDFIYRRRPDGLVLPAGDTNHNRNSMDYYSLPCFLAASYYKDPYLQYEFERKMSLDGNCIIFRLLWQDFSLKGTPPDDLPLSRFSGTPFGWMIARTGWGDESVIAEMKINENFVGNHQHLDGGSFQLYYRGPLAIDTGLYQGTDGGYNCSNNKNYTKRTIAHNSLLIYDPSEVFESYNYGGSDQTQTAANDGGQRMPGAGWKTCNSFKDLLGEEYTVGKTLAHGFGPDLKAPEYTYLKGDITKAYSSKVKDVRRSFVFLNMKESDVPGVLMVFDHVVSSDPSFKKYWLLHSIEEPQIDGNSFTVRRTLDGDNGMLKCDMLFPEAGIEKIGGKGKEFMVFGKNYESYPTKSRPDPTKEYGQWRIQESPLQARSEDIFLNVMQVSDNSGDALKNVTKIDAPQLVGALIGDRAVLFSRNGSPLDGIVEFSVPSGVGRKMKVLVTDLKPGIWRVTVDGKPVKSSVKVSEQDGALYLTAAPGKYILNSK